MTLITSPPGQDMTTPLCKTGGGGGGCVCVCVCVGGGGGGFKTTPMYVCVHVDLIHHDLNQ